MSEFPQYRCYPHRLAWFVIHSPVHFTELWVTGRYYGFFEVQAVQYPEKLRIADMLACEGGAWLEVGEQEYLDFLTECKENLVLRH